VARYPARFQLVLAANLCPCAPADPRDCICPGAIKRRYLGRLSGPLLDRVDLRVQMNPGGAGAFRDGAAGESSADVQARVARARAAAAERWSVLGVRTNAEVPGPVLRRGFRPGPAAMAPLRVALQTFGAITISATTDVPVALRVRSITPAGCGGIELDRTMPGTLTLLGRR
jgi:magnesium chelatase family protein